MKSVKSAIAVLALAIAVPVAAGAIAPASASDGKAAAAQTDKDTAGKATIVEDTSAAPATEAIEASEDGSKVTEPELDSKTPTAPKAPVKH